jgi:hypothetical protein
MLNASLLIAWRASQTLQVGNRHDLPRIDSATEGWVSPTDVDLVAANPQAIQPQWRRATKLVRRERLRPAAEVEEGALTRRSKFCLSDLFGAP